MTVGCLNASANPENATDEVHQAHFVEPCHFLLWVDVRKSRRNPLRVILSAVSLPRARHFQLQGSRCRPSRAESKRALADPLSVRVEKAPRVQVAPSVSHPTFSGVKSRGDWRTDLPWSTAQQGLASPTTVLHSQVPPIANNAALRAQQADHPAEKIAKGERTRKPAAHTDEPAARQHVRPDIPPGLSPNIATHERGHRKRQIKRECVCDWRSLGYEPQPERDHR